MPARRQAAMVAAAAARGGSRIATRPSRLQALFAVLRVVGHGAAFGRGHGEHPEPGAGEGVGAVGRPSSSVGRRRSSDRRFSTASGAPLQMIWMRPLGDAVRGGHAFAVAVEGHLAEPGQRLCSASIRSMPSLAGGGQQRGLGRVADGRPLGAVAVGRRAARRRCTARPPAAAPPVRDRSAAVTGRFAVALDLPVGAYPVPVTDALTGGGPHACRRPCCPR